MMPLPAAAGSHTANPENQLAAFEAGIISEIIEMTSMLSVWDCIPVL
jgi:hypothetical protein